MTSRFIHAVHISSSLLLLLPSISGQTTLLFVFLSVDGHFLFWAITNKTVNIYIQVFVGTYAVISLSHKYLGMQLLGRVAECHVVVYV